MNDGVFLAVSIGVLAGLASARLIFDLSARHCRMLLDDMSLTAPGDVWPFRRDGTDPAGGGQEDTGQPGDQR